MKHTKGPWEARLGFLTNEGQRPILQTSDDPKHIAFVTCQVDFKRGKGWQTECEERDANARLIAAAPELLEACQLFMTAFNGTDPDKIQDSDPDSAAAIRAAITAIAKAKGEA